MNGLGYGTDGDSNSSVTRAGITGIAGNSGITTDNCAEYAGALDNVFDATRVNEELGAQTQITQEFGKEAPKAVGDYASSRQLDLINEGRVNEADKWAEGGAYRVALHTLVGAIATGSVEGALASGTTAVSVPAVDKYLEKQGVDETTRDALLLGLSAAAGAVVGGDTASTATSFSQTQNNYLTHKQIAEWGKELESCVKNRGSQCTISAKEAINNKYTKKSEQQQQELKSACGANGNAQKCDIIRNNYYNVEGIPYDKQADKYAPKIISYGYGSKASSKLGVIQTMHNMEAEGVFIQQTANQEREKGRSGKAFAMEMAPVIAGSVIAGKMGSSRGNVTKVVPNGKHIQVETKTRIISGAKVEDKPTGRVITGNVDLKPTIDRINSGQKSKHRNDGENFRNSQGRLPAKPKGYYTEYVVSPPPTFRYPGAQRVVVGKNGETYYTPNHYESFIRVQ
ncbi:guanyl-specific ribonuclease Sa [Psychrobacter sp. PL15]|uniref:ribonuclease domain-containing protein n=1 Tax=Psychrobacter sp. PL15 TaxID=3071719 RepID=UPI002E0708C1|nr:guanyl-specific ribonuclease Sa [Psychrobacter sp. PL15]